LILFLQKAQFFLRPYLTPDDDGVSGTTFDRPGFQTMLKAIENGLISAVIVKDMSRLGRDYLQVGHYTEVNLPTYEERPRLLKSFGKEKREQIA